MNLEAAFSLREKEVVGLVGGGGKTTLLFALGDELSRPGQGVILTTTTKIWDPPSSSSFARIYSADFSELKKRIPHELDRTPCILIAREKMATGKLRGVSPEWVDELASLSGISHVIVEADGAAGRPLKAPREGEPVFPGSTSLVVPLMGIEALGSRLDEDHVFRAPLAAKLLRLKMGTPVTPEIAADLLAEVVRDKPSLARVIPFINKIDLPGRLESAGDLARALLAHPRLKAERVILGQAACSPRVKEIFDRTPVSP
jgi:probable selenium-dependent hydroxylase accessory protein YqeC